MPDRPRPCRLKRGNLRDGLLSGGQGNAYDKIKLEDFPLSGRLLHSHLVPSLEPPYFYGLRGFLKHRELSSFPAKIASEFGIVWDYRIDLIKSDRFGGVTNGAFDVIVEFNFNESFPYCLRFQFLNYSIKFYNAQSMFIFILSHEFCHFVDGHPENFARKDGSLNMKKCELFCNKQAMKTTRRLGGKYEYIK